jgi:hypothetical protein
MDIEVTLDDGTTYMAPADQVWATVKVRADVLQRISKLLDPTVVSGDGVSQKVSWPIEIVGIEHEPEVMS